MGLRQRMGLQWVASVAVPQLVRFDTVLLTQQ
jgi:hypothetical protein